MNFFPVVCIIRGTFFVPEIHQKLERFPVSAAIQETDELSSDRLIQGGGLFLRPPAAIDFRFDQTAPPATRMNAGSPLFLILGESGCWHTKHKTDIAVDSPGSLAYFVCTKEFEGLEET